MSDLMVWHLVGGLLHVVHVGVLSLVCDPCLGWGPRLVSPISHVCTIDLATGVCVCV